MTVTGDFLPAEDNQDFEQAGPVYPVAFGIEFTPKIQAIALTLLGVAGAFAIFNFLVKPVREDIDQLQTQVSEKEAQIQQQQASLQEVATLQAQLDEALNQRVEIYSLLGDPKSLDTLLLDINQQIQNSNAAIEDVIRTDFNRLDSPQLAALGLNPEQIGRVRNVVAGDPVLQKLLYNSELLNFTPGPVTPLTEGPPELNGKLERYTVDIGMRGLFSQTLSILRNLERLEPLILVKDVRQTVANPPAGVSEADLGGISRQLDTNFTLEVLVPTIDPSEPPPPPEAPAEEGADPGAAPAP